MPVTWSVRAVTWPRAAPASRPPSDSAPIADVAHRADDRCHGGVDGVGGPGGDAHHEVLDRQEGGALEPVEHAVEEVRELVDEPEHRREQRVDLGEQRVDLALQRVDGGVDAMSTEVGDAAGRASPVRLAILRLERGAQRRRRRTGRPRRPGCR